MAHLHSHPLNIVIIMELNIGWSIMVPGIVLYVMIIISKKIIMVAGIVLYAPALALSAVTGLHFEGAVIGIGDHMIHVARNNNNNNNNNK